MTGASTQHYRLRWTLEGPQAELRQVDGEPHEDSLDASAAPDSIISSLEAGWAAFEGLADTGERAGNERAGAACMKSLAHHYLLSKSAESRGHHDLHWHVSQDP